MKPSVIRFNRCCLFIVLSLVLISIPLALSGCGGSSSGTGGDAVINTYKAGIFPFGDAIDSHGNVWVANQGDAIPGPGIANSNVMELNSSGAVVNSCVAGSVPIGIAIDKSGNVWVENYGTTGKPGKGLMDSNVTELSPSCAKIGTYVAGTYPAGGIAIDKSGNVWVTNWGAASGTAGTPGLANGDSNVTELGPSGAVIGTYVAGSSPGGIAIDKSGNVWVANKGNGIPGLANGDSSVTELSPSGAIINSCVAGSHPEGLAIDPAGNVWVVNKGIDNGTPGIPGIANGDSSVTELSSKCTVIGTYVAGSLPETVAVDSAGNVWVANGYNRGTGTSLANSSVTELGPTGAVIHTYAAIGYQPYSLAIDPAGNVWVTNYGDGTPGIANGDSNVQEYMGAAKGPQYFPYSEPQWPGAE